MLDYVVKLIGCRAGAGAIVQAPERPLDGGMSRTTSVNLSELIS